MLFRDDLGREEGYEVGPEPGKGAVIFSCTGEEDFDGLPGDALPPRRMIADEPSQLEIASEVLIESLRPMI